MKGVFDMKAGTLIFLVVLLTVAILVTYGFMLSDYSHVQQEYEELTKQRQDLEAQLEQTHSNFVACQEQHVKKDQMIRELEAKIESLEAEVWNLNIKVFTIKAENATLQSRGNTFDLLRTNPILLASLLFVQVAVLTIRYGRNLSFRFPGKAKAIPKDYVRLSSEEREWIISARRHKINRK